MESFGLRLLMVEQFGIPITNCFPDTVCNLFVKTDSPSPTSNLIAPKDNKSGNHDTSSGTQPPTHRNPSNPSTQLAN